MDCLQKKISGGDAHGLVERGNRRKKTSVERKRNKALGQSSLIRMKRKRSRKLENPRRKRAKTPKGALGEEGLPPSGRKKGGELRNGLGDSNQHGPRRLR